MEEQIDSEKIFLKVFTTLMQVQYPEILIEGNVFSLPAKQLSIEVYSTSFYFQLNPSITRHVKQFSKSTSWYIEFLKFGIKLTASTGKTYSYPALRNYLGKNEKDCLMTATYVFACVNYTINFFSIALQNKQIDQLNKLATEATVTITPVGNGMKIKETTYKKEEDKN